MKVNFEHESSSSLKKEKANPNISQHEQLTKVNEARISAHQKLCLSCNENDNQKVSPVFKYCTKVVTTAQAFPTATWVLCSILSFISWKFGRDKIPSFIPIDQCPSPTELAKQLLDYILNKVTHNGQTPPSSSIPHLPKDSSELSLIDQFNGWYIAIVVLGAVVVGLFVLLYLDYKYELYCSQRPIPNIPKFRPNGGFSLPIFGNLFQLGKSSPLTYWLWKNEARMEKSRTEKTVIERDEFEITTPTHFEKGADPSNTKQGHSPSAEPFFQVRMGHLRCVVVNGHRAIKTLWMTNWASNCSRPVLYTFHKVLSSGQGTTIGTTPFSPMWKKMRKVAAKALNTPSVQSYVPIIEKECKNCIQMLYNDLEALRHKQLVEKLRRVWEISRETIDLEEVDVEELCNVVKDDEDEEDTNDDGIEIDIRKYFETFALKVSLAVAYGFCPQEAEFLEEVIYVEKQINRIRSSLYSVEDYLPFTRYPIFGRIAKRVVDVIRKSNLGRGKGVGDVTKDFEDGEDNELLSPEYVLDIRSRRGNYMNHLMNTLIFRMENGDTTSCIIGNILRTKSLTESELQSTCLTMVSAGLDTIPVNIISAVGHLAKAYGQEVQQKAFDEMIEAYMDPGVLGSGDEQLIAEERCKAWNKCMFEDAMPQPEYSKGCSLGKGSGTCESLGSTVGLSRVSSTSSCGSVGSTNSVGSLRLQLPYLTAVLWESMRHTSAQPINLARETVEPIKFVSGEGGAIEIPSGTMLIMNTLAANFDEERYPNPFKFDPERYLEYTEEPVAGAEAGKDGRGTMKNIRKWRLCTTEGMPHFSFGAGSRVCAGSKLAEREMYMALQRMVLCFEVLPTRRRGEGNGREWSNRDNNKGMESNIWRRFAKVDSMVVEPRDFYVRLRPRKEAVEYLKMLVAGQ